MKKLIVILIFIGITFNACKKDEVLSYSAQLAKDEATIDKYLADNNIANVLTDTSGFRYIVKVQGTGKIPDIATPVALNFTVTDLSGNLLTSSTNEQFYLISQQITGLGLGLLKMPRGSNYVFYIPSGLTSGPGVPFGTNIIVNVTMVDDSSEFATEEATLDAYFKTTKDTVIRDTSGVRIVITKKGTSDFPLSTSTVVISYNAHILNVTKDFDSSPSFQFSLSDPQWLPGLEIGMKYVSEGSQASIYFPSRYGYGFTGTSDNVIPPNSILVFDVALIAIQ